MRYYTKNNKEVTERVEQGKTTIFLTSKFDRKKRKEAVKHSKNTGSYVYDLYTENKDNERVPIGYAVPR